MKNQITKETILKDLQAIKNDLLLKEKEIKNLGKKYNISVQTNAINEYTNQIKEKYPFAFHYMRSGVGFNSLERDADRMAFILNNKKYHLINYIYIIQEMPDKLRIKFSSFDKDRLNFSLNYMSINNWKVIKEYQNGNAIIEFSDKDSYNEAIDFLMIPYGKTDKVLAAIDNDFVELAKKNLKESKNYIWSISNTVYTLVGEGYHQINYNPILKKVGF